MRRSERLDYAGKDGGDALTLDQGAPRYASYKIGTFTSEALKRTEGFFGVFLCCLSVSNDEYEAITALLSALSEVVRNYGANSQRTVLALQNALATGEIKMFRPKMHHLLQEVATYAGIKLDSVSDRTPLLPS